VVAASVAPALDMQASHALGSAHDDQCPPAGGRGGLQFPPFPGENPLQHEAHIWLEIAEARLASAGLLIVANGGTPAAARHILDVPLDQLPPLPPDHRDFERRIETRIRIETENRKNAARRYDLTMAAWTSIYAALKECTARTAPLLSRELLDVCDLSLAGVADGYFDGPRAWRMAVHRLAGEERTKQDKEYYRTAESLQRSKPLPDGCSAAEYSKRALAYLVHIKPHLPYSSSPLDAAEYLIDLLPKGLRAMGKQLKFELKSAGQLEDLMHVAKRCRELVFEEQRSPQPSSALCVTADELRGFDSAALSATTGIHFALAPDDSRGGGAGHAFASTSARDAGGASDKWCDRCPHPNGAQCFCDPRWSGTVPSRAWCTGSQPYGSPPRPSLRPCKRISQA